MCQSLHFSMCGFCSRTFFILEEKYMYCAKCGKKLPDEAKFCLECGEKTAIILNTKHEDLDNHNNPDTFVEAIKSVAWTRTIAIIAIICIIIALSYFIIYYIDNNQIEGVFYEENTSVGKYIELYSNGTAVFNYSGTNINGTYTYNVFNDTYELNIEPNNYLPITNMEFTKQEAIVDGAPVKYILLTGGPFRGRVFSNEFYNRKKYENHSA